MSCFFRGNLISPQCLVQGSQGPNSLLGEDRHKGVAAKFVMSQNRGMQVTC